jgi:hypothetical protein
MGINFFVLNQNFFVREKNFRFKKKIDPHLLLSAPRPSLFRFPVPRPLPFPVLRESVGVRVIRPPFFLNFLLTIHSYCGNI